MGAFARMLVDQPYAGRAELGKPSLDVGDAVCGVVQLCFGVTTIPRDRRILVERKKKLDERSAGLQPNRLDALIVNDFSKDFFESERLRIEPQRRFQVFDYNGNVINFHYDVTQSLP